MHVMQSTVGQSVTPAGGCRGQKGLRILSLDGGGMKVKYIMFTLSIYESMVNCTDVAYIKFSSLQGLIQIEMLKMLEQMTGKRISELFDWVVGTSIGGILALGMIYGIGLLSASVEFAKFCH